jgi:hypothetical protein
VCGNCDACDAQHAYSRRASGAVTPTVSLSTGR